MYVCAQYSNLLTGSFSFLTVLFVCSSVLSSLHANLRSDTKFETCKGVYRFPNMHTITLSKHSSPRSLINSQNKVRQKQETGSWFSGPVQRHQWWLHSPQLLPIHTPSRLHLPEKCDNPLNYFTHNSMRQESASFTPSQTHNDVWKTPSVDILKTEIWSSNTIEMLPLYRAAYTI